MSEWVVSEPWERLDCSRYLKREKGAGLKAIDHSGSKHDRWDSENANVATLGIFKSLLSFQLLFFFGGF
jgi:hypothetical protein